MNGYGVRFTISPPICVLFKSSVGSLRDQNAVSLTWLPWMSRRCRRLRVWRISCVRGCTPILLATKSPSRQGAHLQHAQSEFSPDERQSTLPTHHIEQGSTRPWSRQGQLQRRQHPWHQSLFGRVWVDWNSNNYYYHQNKATEAINPPLKCVCWIADRCLSDDRSLSSYVATWSHQTTIWLNTII